MNQPNKLIVEASIPSLDNPDARVYDIVTGTEPHVTAEVATGIEAALHTLGQKALVGGYLSINRVVSRQNYLPYPNANESANKATVVTKAIDRSKVKLADGYRWSDKPDNTSDNKS